MGKADRYISPEHNVRVVYEIYAAMNDRGKLLNVVQGIVSQVRIIPFLPSSRSLVGSTLRDTPHPL